MILWLVVIDSALSFVWRWEWAIVEVPFHSDEPPSPQWSVNNFHCGYETLCVTTGKDRRKLVRTDSVICDSYTSKEFFFFHLLVCFPLRVEIEVKLFIKNVYEYSTWKRVYISLSLWLLRSRHMCT